jgi:hypothetical protein
MLKAAKPLENGRRSLHHSQLRWLAQMIEMRTDVRRAAL